MNKYYLDIYKMYEEEVNKVKQLTSDNNFLRLEVYNLKTDLRNVNNRIDRTVEQAKHHSSMKLIY